MSLAECWLCMSLNLRVIRFKWNGISTLGLWVNRVRIDVAYELGIDL